MVASRASDGGETSDGPRFTAPQLRVFGGLLVGIGIGPIVVGVLVFALDVAFGETVADLSRPAIHLFALVFGGVCFQAARLFYTER